MLNAPVSLLIAVGTLAAAGPEPATVTPTFVVTATAPIPAAFIKFLREYFIANLLLLLSVVVNQELLRTASSGTTGAEFNNVIRMVSSTYPDFTGLIVPPEDSLPFRRSHLI